MSADFMKLLQTISDGRLPLDNIALLLLLEVARWYSLDNTSNMFYWPTTQLFWKVGYKLFHGRFLRFMQGEKNEGTEVSGTEEPGAHNPTLSSINFAVPNTSTIRNFQDGVDLPQEIKPGIIHENIDLRASGKDSLVLSVDGKKVSPGFTKDFGDVDLFGHEKHLTLKEKIEQKHQELEYIQGVINVVSNKAESMNASGGSVSDLQVYEKLCHTVKMLSCRLKDLRELDVRLNNALIKFRKLAGDNWRNSKYVFVISSIQASQHQLKQTVAKLLSVIDDLLSAGAKIQGSEDFVKANEVDPSFQRNWVRLKSPSEISVDCRQTQFIQQRSDDWFRIREEIPVSGSTLFTALGLSTLKDQQKHFDKVKKGKIETVTIPIDVQTRMDYGAHNEINAIATLVGKILPFYQATQSYVEVGCHKVNISNEPLLVVSPDGALAEKQRLNTDHTYQATHAIEIKCPTSQAFVTPVHYSIPDRYIMQLLAEMKALEANELFYLSWSPESTAVHKVCFDPLLWNKIENEVKDIYSGPGKRPSHKRPFSKECKDLFREFKNTNTEFVCEVPSCYAKDTNISQTTHDSPFQFALPSQRNLDINRVDVATCMSTAASCVEDAYQLCRIKATEVLVWILADTNRMWQPEIPHALPVAYALKGYSLDCEVMRRMCDNVQQILHEKGLSVVCSTFDGQWNTLATRDGNGRPLTLVQLQRDVAGLVTKLTKAEIISFLSVYKPAMESIRVCSQKSGHIEISMPLIRKVAKAQRLVLAKATKREKTVQDFSVDPNCLPESALFNDEIMSDLNMKTSAGCQLNHGNPDPNSLHDDEDEHGHDDLPTNEGNFAGKVLHALQSSKDEKLAAKWKDKTTDNLLRYMESACGLSKLIVKELDVIYSMLPHQNDINIHWRSMTKSRKASYLSQIVGDKSTIESYWKAVPTLKSACLQVLRQRHRHNGKDVLNAVYSTLVYREEKEKWAQQSPFAEGYVIDGIDEYITWFSYPEFSATRNKMEPKCLDGEHLLVNARVKMCKDGMLGLSKQAWHDVSKHDSNIISPSLVVDLVDKQSAENAKRTFSPDVQKCMEELGYDKESKFCELVRNWYQAEDDPGISASKRAHDRLMFRNYLLDGVDFEQFPQYGNYIKGMPRVMFEGFLQSIDTHMQLYPLCKGGTYNQRSVSSLVNETFFGELQDLEPTRLGCPKAVNIPRMMATVTEIMHYRHNPQNR